MYTKLLEVFSISSGIILAVPERSNDYLSIVHNLGNVHPYIFFVPACCPRLTPSVAPVPPQTSQVLLELRMQLCQNQYNVGGKSPNGTNFLLHLLIRL